jgi:hypothetical protein
MKKSIPYLIIAVLVAVIFIQNSCEPNPTEPKKIVIPEIKGKSPITKPVQVVIEPDKPFTIPKQHNNKKENEFLQKQIDSLLKQNNELIEAFAAATDSLQNELYKKAISIRYYEECYGDEFVEIASSGFVRGEIQSMKFNYTIREKSIKTPPDKEVTFRLMGGVEFGNTLQFDSFLVKGNLGFQNKKGNVFTTSFDTQERIWIGYNASIFKIKR